MEEAVAAVTSTLPEGGWSITRSTRTGGGAGADDSVLIYALRWSSTRLAAHESAQELPDSDSLLELIASDRITPQSGVADGDRIWVKITGPGDPAGSPGILSYCRSDPSNLDSMTACLEALRANSRGLMAPATNSEDPASGVQANSRYATTFTDDKLTLSGTADFGVTSLAIEPDLMSRLFESRPAGFMSFASQLAENLGIPAWTTIDRESLASARSLAAGSGRTTVSFSNSPVGWELTLSGRGDSTRSGVPSITLSLRSLSHSRGSQTSLQMLEAVRGR